MKLGVYTALDPLGGGIYQYSLTVLKALEELRTELDSIIVFDPKVRQGRAAWRHAGWSDVPSQPPTPRGMARQIVTQTLGETSANRLGALVGRSNRRTGQRKGPQTVGSGSLFGASSHGSWLRAQGIDLMLYPAPTSYSFETGIPYVMAIHDLQHRIHPEFPEVSAGGEWEAREYLFANGAQFAEAILVDSQVGREYVIEFYGHLIAAERIRVLPFVVPPYLARPNADGLAATLSSLDLPQPYLLFPAQFWPHKNHRRVTEAIAQLRQQGIDVTVVMTGSASGDLRARVLREVREIVDRERLSDLVRVLGYVDDATMAALYSGASGLLLPTFFGPTNVPVVEAWAMGVPVLTSDIRGIREHCGDAAILVDPLSTEAIANGIRYLWEDEELRERLVRAGRQRMAENDPAAFRLRLGAILKDVVEGLGIQESHRVPA